jgi:hypothetical protein
MGGGYGSDSYDSKDFDSGDYEETFEVADGYMQQSASAAAVDSVQAGGGAAGETGEASAESAEDDARKEIKNAWAELVVKDVGAAYAAVASIMKDLGGYEFDKAEENYDQYHMISLTIKLPPQNLPAFETRLYDAANENEIRSFRVASEDITDGYYDVMSRLTSMKLSLQQYLSLISKAQRVEDVLAIQREITLLQAEIDSYQGRLNAWDKLVRYATVRVTISRAQDPLSQTKNETWNFNTSSEVFNAMGNGFISTGNTVYRAIVGFFVILVSLLPALVPAVVIVFVILHIRRRKRAARASRMIGAAGRAPGGIAESAPESEITAAAPDGGGGAAEPADGNAVAAKNDKTEK